MVKIKDIDEITVIRKSKDVLEISTIYGGYYRHRTYMGYSKAQAIKMFKDSIKKGEI